MNNGILNTRAFTNLIQKTTFDNNRIKVLTDNAIKSSIHHTNNHTRKDLEYKKDNFSIQLKLTSPGHICIPSSSPFKEIKEDKIIDSNEELIHIQDTYMNSELMKSAYKKIYSLFGDVLKS